MLLRPPGGFIGTTNFGLSQIYNGAAEPWVSVSGAAGVVGVCRNGGVSAQGSVCDSSGVCVVSETRGLRVTEPPLPLSPFLSLLPLSLSFLSPLPPSSLSLLPPPSARAEGGMIDKEGGYQSLSSYAPAMPCP
eukprot:2054071-Rhodomonas_salina.1